MKIGVDLDTFFAARLAGSIAANVAITAGMNEAEIKAEYQAAYDAVLNDAQRRMQTTELGKIERGTARKIAEMNQRERQTT